MISVVRNEEFRSGNCISSFNVNFTAIFTAEFGQCHQINIKLTNNIIIAGKMQGLSVLLRANLHDYLNITTNNYMDEGFAVQLHFGPQVALGQWMTIAPGFHYMFAMKERRLRARPPSDMFGVGYNLQEYVSLFGSKPPCEMYPKLKYDIAEKYSRPQCMHECSMDNFNKYCNCLPFYDSPSVRICELEELADCYNLLIEYNASRPSEACLLGCKEPCSDRTVETSITFGRFPPRSQIKDMEASLANIGESATLEQIREDFIMLDIYFEKLSITVVEWYEAQGFESLISSLGGVMSLWAGMSILTIVQAIVYFCHAFCCGLCLARKGKKNSPKVVPLSTASLTTSRSQPNLSTSKA
uniref:Uncharacterized protein n=1 Tax=Plectus sambesii TaxID=2011161 RepID=A0A914W535_9BILA